LPPRQHRQAAFGARTSAKKQKESDIVLHLLGVIIIGAIVGLIAKFLVPGRDPGGFIVTPLIGIGGALVATYLGQFLHIYDPGQNAGFIASVVGAVIILLVYRFIRQRSGG
jgi:uncharacterized membrane protein YeaQ/YmgE (transglycosylase-associated protein family)